MTEYKSAYTGQEIDAGIAKANTAIQDVSDKVDKVEGKGLSTNDYTTEEKTKLAGIDMSSKQDTLVSGTNIKTINNESILGSGNITISGGSATWGGITGTLSDQTDLNTALASKVSNTDYATSSTGGVVKVSSGDYGLIMDEGVLKGSAKTASQYSNMSSKGLVAKGTLENVLEDKGYQEKLVSGTNIKTINGANILGSGNIVIEGGDTPASNAAEEVDLSPYYYPEYTLGKINADGTIDTTGVAYVTNLLPVIPNEKIFINSTVTNCIAYYDINEVFISRITISSGLNEYTVPETAKLIRFENAYNGGRTIPLDVRQKDLTGFYKSFYDVLMSPHFTNPKIQFGGDSNTVGYGLASGEKSWANLFIDELSQITTHTYNCYDSKYVNTIGCKEYSTQYNFIANAYTEIYTNATQVTLSYGNSYSGAWEWYVDNVKVSGSENQTSISDLDGNHHLIKVLFTAGQVTGAKFTIPKTISCTNNAVTGSGVGPIASGFDWTLIMIGTNNRNVESFTGEKDWNLVRGKLTYIYPFPNHKTDSSYTHGEWYTYSSVSELFKQYDAEIINCSDVAGAIFIDDTYYQEDKIHYNANGHKMICNIVSGKLGLPTYYKLN